MLITPADEAKVEQISETGTATSAETSWLCDLVQRLARLKPTEEDFPDYAALINTISGYAFALRFVNAVPFEQETRIYEGHPAQLGLFDHTTENEVCDAFLCVRPYIRLVEPRDERVLDRLARQGRIRVNIDGERVINDGSVEEHLVDFDGYGLRRKPFQFQATAELFPGANLEPNPPIPGLIAPSEGEGTPGAKRGIFLPNGSKIQIWLSGVNLKKNEHLLLSTGLVMGHYTTRGVRSPAGPSSRPSRKAWDPRD